MSAKNYSIPLCVAFIVILGLLIYGNALSNPFIWDDYGLLVENELIRSLANFPSLFSRNILGTQELDGFYRPLQMFSYMLEYQIWKLSPLGFRLTNILLHILTGILLFFLIDNLFKQRFLSLAVSLMFIAHPVQTEAVVYIASRADLLTGMFILAAVLAYVRFLDHKKAGRLCAAVIFFVLALLSKEFALVTPALLILCQWIKTRSLKWAHLLPIFVIETAYIALRWGVEVSGAIKTTLWQRIPGAFLAFFEYIRLLVVPTDLHMGYGLKLFSFFEPKVWLGINLFVITFVVIWQSRNRWATLLFALLWYLICLIPVLNLYPMNAIVAEHWLYLPSIGFLLIPGLVFTNIHQKSQALAFSVLALLIGIYGTLTVRQNQLWQNPVSFYQRVIQFNPSFVQAYNNLGSVYARQGQFKQAKLYFKKALQIKPQHIEAITNLALIEERLNNREEAAKLLRQAVAVDPKDRGSQIKLASLLSESGETHAAKEIYEDIELIDPTNSDALNNQGLLLYKEGRVKEAREYYQKAVRARADNKEAINNLANILLEDNQFDQAKELYIQALAIDSKYIEALNNLGYLHYKMNEKILAEQYYKRALAINPEFVDANNNLGLLYFERGEDNKAQRHYEKSLLGDPNNLDALNVLGIIYGKKGDYKEAEALFVKALEIDPGYVSAIQNLSKVRALNRQ